MSGAGAGSLPPPSPSPRGRTGDNGDVNTAATAGHGSSGSNYLIREPRTAALRLGSMLGDGVTSTLVLGSIMVIVIADQVAVGRDSGDNHWKL